MQFFAKKSIRKLTPFCSTRTGLAAPYLKAVMYHLQQFC